MDLRWAVISRTVDGIFGGYEGYDTVYDWRMIRLPHASVSLRRCMFEFFF